MRSRLVSCVVAGVAVLLTAGAPLEGAGRGEPGPTFPARVELVRPRGDLDRLNLLGVNIDGVFDDWARVYLTDEELGKLQRSLLQEVQAYARSSSYDLVVGDGVLYVNESMDITPQVLSALQARDKTGGTKPASPPPAKPAFSSVPR